MIIDVLKIFVPATLAFVVGILFTPLWTHYLYKYKMWKVKAGKTLRDGTQAVVFNELHKDKEVGTPRMGGVVALASVVIVVSALWVLSHLFSSAAIAKLEFLSRNQTWIPLLTLVIGAFIGMIDDVLEIRGTGNLAGGLSLFKRLSIVGTIGIVWGYWFYEKLDVVAIGLPFGYELVIGTLIIPLFAFIMIVLYSGGVIDGLDGLAGGVFATIFAAYAAIAFYQQQINLAAFCATVVGGILAFLWFNIPPARFYMSETGSMALTLTLAVVAFMTDSLSEGGNPSPRGGYGLLVLPVIALPLLATSLSNIMQILSKKVRGKKLFRIAPLHHHFEALGWPAYKVTMRYWIISVMCAILGITLALIG